MRYRLVITIAVLFAALSASAQTTSENKKAEEPTTGKWLNSRITFTFGDDNVLLDEGESKRNSPTAYFGACNDSALDRTVENQCKGASNFTHLLIYRRLKLSKYFQPEAALSINLDLGHTRLADGGSYIKANYFMDDRHETLWSITLFPVDSDVMRLGFHRDISFGGSNTFPRNFRRGMVPGLKFDLDMRYWYLWVGTKAALVRSPAEDILDNPGGNTIKNVERTFYGGLFGAGFEVLDTGLRFEVNGGIFQKGTNTRQNALGKPIVSGGVSGRVSFRHGMELGRAIDIRIYQEDPIRDELFKKEQFKTGSVSVRVEGEGSFLLQDLEDPDRVNSTILEPGYMAHLGFGLKAGFFRVFLNGTVRSLSAITHDTPGFIPYQALSENAETTPEIFVSLSGDYTIDPYGLTFALSLGVQQPATYVGMVPVGLNASAIDQGRRKLVIRGSAAGDWDILPPGQDEIPVIISRFDIRWNYYDAFGVIAQVSYAFDNNRASVLQDGQGHNLRVFDTPHYLGFSLISQVRF